IYLNTAVNRVERSADHVTLYSARGAEQYSQVIFACHSDQALAMLAAPTTAEQVILGAIPYKDNDVVLHTDSSVLPQRKKAWASWNYPCGHNQQGTVAVTYYMNRLQSLDDAPGDFRVSLKKSMAIDVSKVISRFNYSCPLS